MKKYLLLTLALLISSFTFAGELPDNIEMADTLYRSGKIYVVVGVIAIIFVGITAYLVAIDRKLSRLEKEMLNKQ